VFDPTEWGDLDEPVPLYLSEDICCILDFEDYLWAIQWLWKPAIRNGGIYAARSFGGSTLYLHREIMLRIERPKWQHTSVDHINRDTLDDTRQNLRWTTVKQNNRNRR